MPPTILRTTDDPIKPTITVDTRENIDIAYKMLLRAGTCNVLTDQLPYGDYKIEPPTEGSKHIGEVVIVERKTTQDLVQSHFGTERRLDKQRTGLSAYPHSIIVVIGTDLLGPNWSYPYSSRIGLLGSLALRAPRDANKPFMVQVPREEDFGHLLLYWAKCLTENRLYLPLNLGLLGDLTKYKAAGLDNKLAMKMARVSVLTAVPKVGYKKAKKIIDHFNGNLRAIVDSSIEDLMEIEGVGGVIAKNIWRLFNDA